VRAPRRVRTVRGGRRRKRMREALRTAIRSERLLIYAIAAGGLLFFAATVYFMFGLHLTFVEAMYFTASTMLTVGYGDITPYLRHAGAAAMLIAVAVMLMGVTLGGILIATLSSALNRAQETALAGLRRIHADDHVIVCGAGNVGTRVIDFLLAMNERVVVVERRPSAWLLELARSRRIDLIAADATSDDTLGFCSVGTAQSLVAVTDSDTANLETAWERSTAMPACRS
jgi:voltage-gated potassium channel